MTKYANRLDIEATPSLECPACQDARLHDPEEWMKFHPLRGQGIAEGRRTYREEV